MKPHGFDALTSREMIGDDRARSIEAKARADADLGREAYSPPIGSDALTYWGRCQIEFARSVYHEQFRKRLERNDRKASKEGKGHQ